MSRPRTTNKHLPKYVTIQRASYWYRPPTAEKPIRICAVGDEKALYTYLAAAAPSIGPLTTISDCIDRYQREIVPGMRERTQKDYVRHLAKLKATFGHMAPQDLKPRDVGRWLDVPKGKIHRNKLVGILSTVYNKMIGKWFVEGVTVNPCEKVERHPAKKRTRYITHEEFKIIHAAMPPRHKIAMELAYWSTQRQGDVLSMKWQDVTNDGFYVQQGKTGKKLRVSMKPGMRAALVKAKKLTPQLPREYVLRTRKGKKYSSEGFRAVWQRRMRKLYASGAIKERCTFHDLRAKSVSDFKTLQGAMETAGHTTMAMTRGVYDRGIRDVEGLESDLDLNNTGSI